MIYLRTDERVIEGWWPEQTKLQRRHQRSYSNRRNRRQGSLEQKKKSTKIQHSKSKGRIRIKMTHKGFIHSFFLLLSFIELFVYIALFCSFHIYLQHCKPLQSIQKRFLQKTQYQHKNWKSIKTFFEFIHGKANKDFYNCIQL